MPRTAKITAKPTRRSLLQFMRDKRKLTCKLCQLPETVRAELSEAREKKVPRALQLEWLVQEHGLKITGTELDIHRNGRHDER
jgi:hypothetical protein